MKKNMKKMVSAITMTAMAASMFAMPAAAEEKTSSITYPLETDIESVSWYVISIYGKPCCDRST